MYAIRLKNLIVVFICVSFFWLIIFTIRTEDLVVKYQTPVHIMKNKSLFVSNMYYNEQNENIYMKYILLWTLPNTEPFVFLGNGQNNFINRKCKHVNCFITSNRTLLGDYTMFDLIAFHGPESIYLSQGQLPKRRSPHQKYVFASIESADYYPVCTNKFDEFFNWTWTYKLNSDVRWGYVKVKDNNANVIGPNKEMHWMNVTDMEPVSDEFKEQLKSKSKAAAWFASNCKSLSKREIYVRSLHEELLKYNLTVDVYGKCGSFNCPLDNSDECDNMVKDNYYFYLSFENSLSEDYVTEKLFRALSFNTVPIVYGAANYTRFMPDGIYLNARELGVKRLAEKMHELIQTPEEYANYFRWKHHYSYHSKVHGSEADEYCTFCDVLNDERLLKTPSVYNNFKDWWDPPGRC